MLTAVHGVEAFGATIEVAGTPGGAGLVIKAADGQCSLIEAIENANAETTTPNVDCTPGDNGADIINLPADATFLLDDTSVPTPFPNIARQAVSGDTFSVGVSGLPTIASTITIQGNGSRAVRDPSAAKFRIIYAAFPISDTATTAANLTIDALDLVGGVGLGGGGGVQIRGHEALIPRATLRNLTITGNTCEAPESHCNGGGIHSLGGRLVVSRCTITGNATQRSENSSGGGIFVFRPAPEAMNPSEVTIEHSTISHNQAGLAPDDTEFDGNAGGGIVTSSNDSTSNILIRNSTIAFNSPGGLTHVGTAGITQQENVFVGNFDHSCRSTIGGPVGSNSNPSFTDAPFELPCTGALDDPDLATKVGPLADNGGATHTHALLPGADPIDQATSFQCQFGPENDQRGILHNIDGENGLPPLPVQVGDPPRFCDVGAYESTDVFDYGDAPAPYPTVLDATLGAQLTTGGALHELPLPATGPAIAAVVYLGACVDGDAKPTMPSAAAVDDDGDTGARVIGTCATAGDDEDGIGIPSTITDAGAHDLTVTTPAGQKAVLDGWIDFTRDGDWDDPGEKVIDGLATTGGVQTFPIVVPASFSSGGSYARFRLSTGGLDTPGGFSGNGEVEDYAVTLQDLQICGDSFLDTNEDCDLGSANGTATSCCSSSCDFQISGSTCRASAGVCDPAETCSGSSSQCPADALASSAEVCRDAVGTCDVTENCTGSSPNCPADVLVGAGLTCRTADGVCDAAESCTGSSGACPEDQFLPSTTECNPSTSVCDPAENCSGTAAGCPTNQFAPSTQQCRPAAGVCDLAESCTGSAAACPSDALAPSSQPCRASAGVCDVAENCSGSEVTCPVDGFASAAQVCRAASGSCDAPESCSGSAAACPADLLLPSGTECRPAADECDPAEACTGASNLCPVNETCEDLQFAPDCDEEIAGCPGGEDPTGDVDEND